MGWKWNDAVGGAIDGLMSYGPYGAIAGGVIGGWSKDFDKGITGNSRAGLVQKAYGAKGGNMGTKIMGNFSGDERDSQVLNEKGKFDVGKTVNSVADMVSSYYGMKGGGGIGGGGGGGGSITMGGGGSSDGGFDIGGLTDMFSNNGGG